MTAIGFSPVLCDFRVNGVSKSDQCAPIQILLLSSWKLDPAYASRNSAFRVMI